MRLTVAQLPAPSVPGSEPWQRLAEHVRTAASDLVLLPEMACSPWLPTRRAVDADAWLAAVAAHDRASEQLSDLIPAVVVGTRPRVEAGVRLNRGFVATAGAEPEDWRAKYYLPDEPGYWEATWYERGDSQFDQRTIGGVRCGLQVCTEMWFQQHSRAYGQAGAQLLLVPRATPRSTTSRWVAGGRVAAVVSGAYCASSNLWAPAGVDDADLGGVGWVIDPEGEVLAMTSESTPFLTVEIDPAVADRAKEGYPRYVAD